MTCDMKYLSEAKLQLCNKIVITGKCGNKYKNMKSQL